MQVTSSVNNLIIGKLYVDHSGIMRIRNTQSNLTARLKFHDAGMFNSKDAHLVLPWPADRSGQASTSQQQSSRDSTVLRLKGPHQRIPASAP